MKVLVADDEAPARQRLVALLRELDPGIEIVAEVGDGGAALAMAQTHRPDLALLDIRMPGTDGIQAALRMAELPQAPVIVFVTAYDEYALAAFDANAIDYLLKPVRRERLGTALQKAGVLTQAQREALQDTLPGLSVSQGGRLRRIPLDEIICLRADSKYVEVWHKGGTALSDHSLKAIEEQYPGRFQRVHRNALVDPRRMRELRPEGTATVLEVEGLDRPLEVSRRHLAQVRKMLRS